MALFWLTINGMLLLTDIVLLIRIIYPFKLSVEIPVYFIIGLIGLAIFSALLLVLRSGKAEGLVASAFTEKDHLSTWELPLAFVCTYLPMVLTIVLAFDQPNWY